MLFERISIGRHPGTQRMPTRSSIRNDMTEEAQVINDVRIKLTAKPLSLDESLIVKVQARFRMIKQRRQYRAIQKKARYRKSVINELIQTEQNYVYSLHALLEFVRKPTLEFLPKEEVAQMFSSMPEIYQLNQEFLQQLKSRFDLYQPYVRFADILIQYSHYFKIYFIYYSEYQSAIQVMKQYRQENLKFKALLSTLEGSAAFSYLDMEGMMVKPIQRLPKYDLLLRDWIAHTDSDHPDYENLKIAQKNFSDVNESNNKNLDRNILNSKLFELQRLYGEPNNLKIVEANRQFVDEVYLHFYDSQAGKPVLVYYLSNLILVIENYNTNNKRLLSSLSLTSSSLVKDLPDTVTFKNIFVLIGDGSPLTFICESAIQKEQQMNLVQYILDRIIDSSRRKSNIENYPILVRVLQQERSRLGFFSSDSYTMEVSIKHISIRIKLMQNDIQSIINKAQEQNISIKMQGQMSLTTFQSQDNQNRKILFLENLVHTILINQEVRKNPEQFLQLLGLPKDFYILPEKTPQIAKTITDSVKDSGLRKTISPNHMESGSIKTSKSPQMFTSPVRTLERNSTGSKLQVFLLIHLNKQNKIALQIPPDTLVKELYDIALEHVQLKFIFDFKFYFNNMVVDDHSSVSSIIPKASIFDLFRPENVFELRKAIFLDLGHEKTLFNSNKVRLELIYNQLKLDLKGNNLLLTFKDYGLLFAMIIKIEGLKLNESTLMSLLDWIPQNIRRAIRREIWLKFVPAMVVEVENSIQQKLTKTKYDRVALTQLVFISTLAANPCFGHSLFEVNVHSGGKTKLPTGRCLFALSYKGISFISNGRRDQLLSYEYYQLQPLQFFGNQITLKQQNSSESIIFISSVAYQIQIIFQLYIDVLVSMEDNS